MPSQATTTRSHASMMHLPDTDDGLPGSGPIRRYDWFRQLWGERHALWSTRAAQDQGAVVFLGDSITQGWGDDLAGRFPGIRIANRGISGDTTRGMLIRLQDDVIALHPRAVVLLAGTNDLEEGASPETIASNVALILRGLESGAAGAPIVLCEVFPSSPEKKRPKELIVRVNELYAGLARGDARVTLLPTWKLFADADGDAKPSEFPDLLHPNELGYEKWAALLGPVIAMFRGDGDGGPP